MVKDFNSTGSLKTDDAFMSGCDVPHLALKDIVNGVNPYTGNSIEEPEEKFPFYLYHVNWRFAKQKKYKFKVIEPFVVENEDVFNLDNWKPYKER